MMAAGPTTRAAPPPQRADQLARRVGPRVRKWLLSRYPWPRCKRIARDFSCSVELAEKWHSGKDPTIAAFSAMVALWGVPFLEFVFAEAFAESRATPGAAGAAIHSAVAAAMDDHQGVRQSEAAGRLAWRIGSGGDPFATAVTLLGSRICGELRWWERAAARIAAAVDAGCSTFGPQEFTP